MTILRQRGFGAIMAIMILVILSALAAAVARFSSAQQIMSTQDVLGARAWAAAQAGTEWGLFQALQSNACNGPVTTMNLGEGISVSVACVSQDRNEGESVPGVAQQVRVFTITATACNGGGGCPNAGGVGSVGYVERQRVVTAICPWNGAACLPP
ncbi:MAG: MSHA biogenesis protein MshP [Betaproteobacteria bacterium]|nr:MAG: MSHA biogenesis protein MshP [Betaproteobacteria bacterium]